MPGAKNRSGGNRVLSGDRTRKDGMPELPSGESEQVVSKWRELIAHIDPGILRRADCHMLLSLCRLLVEADELTAVIASDPANDRLRRLRLAVVDRVSRLSPAFGLSPMDRARLKTDPDHSAGNDALAGWKHSIQQRAKSND